MRWAVSCCSGSSLHEQLFSNPLNCTLPESHQPFPPCSHWAPCKALLKLGSQISGAHLALSLQHEFRTPLPWQSGRGSVQHMPLFTGLFSDKKRNSCLTNNAPFTSIPERILQKESSVESIREATIIHLIHFVYYTWRLWQLRVLKCIDKYKGEVKIERLKLFFQVFPLPLCEGSLAFWFLNAWWFHSPRMTSLFCPKSLFLRRNAAVFCDAECVSVM